MIFKNKDTNHLTFNEWMAMQYVYYDERKCSKLYRDYIMADFILEATSDPTAPRDGLVKMGDTPCFEYQEAGIEKWRNYIARYRYAGEEARHGLQFAWEQYISEGHGVDSY